MFIEQVLLNLIINGMDAMNEVAEDARHLTLRSKAQGPDTIEIAVLDSGTGIALDLLPRFFDTFVTTKPDGMGLGLAISRSIIQEHKGRIWADNQPSGGAAVRFTLQAAAK